MRQQKCRQCGICCRKGGPALHRVDLPLVRRERLARELLITYRPGEPVFDNVAEAVTTLDSDLIKIRSQQGTRQCILFDAQAKSCRTYEDRPQECRVLECWAPEELMRIYQKDRLTRYDLLSKESALGDLVAFHDEKCDCREVGTLVGPIRAEQDRDAMFRLSEMVEFDLGFRREVGERTNTPVQGLELYFGRSLASILPSFGLIMEKEQDKTIFRPDPAYSGLINSQNRSSRI